MYSLTCETKYSSKLNIENFSDRLNELNNTNKKIIIYIKEEFEVTTFRYRTYNIMQALEKSNQYFATCFLVEELKKLSKLIDKIDLIILQRCKWSMELESFLNYAKYKGKKIMYDIDDLIYDNKYIPSYLSNIGDYTDKSISSLVSMSSLYHMSLSFCDKFITSTPKLAEFMKKDFGKDVFVYHNFLNVEQEEISENIRNQKKECYDDNRFVIGYFSGSGTHVRDLDIVLDAILRLMDQYDDIYFEIVGFMALNKNFNKYLKNKRMIMKPLVPYQKLQYLMGSVDLNIVPLQNNQFNNCKSELKYFEASIVDTITIASNNEVYGHVITDGENGFLANDFDWYEKLEYIYLNKENLYSIKEKAREYSLKEYGCYNQTEKLNKMFDKIMKEK